MDISAFTRDLETPLLNALIPGKAIVLLGARRVGKTSLIKKLVADNAEQAVYFDAEDWNVKDAFSEPRLTYLKEVIGDKKIVCIDEAQQIPDIGRVAKVMVDHIEGLRLILSGSSTLKLADQTGEPLTGRKRTFIMYPLSQREMGRQENRIETMSRLEERLLYGSYPEVIQAQSEKMKKIYLKELVNDYLLKDVLMLENIRNSDKLRKMLRMLAFQVGQQVSTEELGNAVGLNRATVDRYLDLLAKSFVIFRLEGYSKNLRKEITKMNKWFFYDTGIRNALNNTYQPMSIRPDCGSLWENYIISERKRFVHYNEDIASFYYWRTYDGQEIDLIEQRGEHVLALDMKWRSKKKKIPGAWKKHYPDADFQIITKDNYHSWLI